jgi:hypothetical protein
MFNGSIRQKPCKQNIKKIEGLRIVSYKIGLASAIFINNIKYNF